MCGVYHVTVPQEDDVAAQDQAESLGDSIADHLESLVTDVAVQVNFYSMMLQFKYNLL